MSAILEDRENLEISHPRSCSESHRFLRVCLILTEEREANLFYFAVNIGRHFFQSTLVCLQIEESSVGLFFVNCFLSYFFVKKYLLVGASSMLWTGQWMSESVSQ